ncbi:MAG TPA: EAL domain-containing protein [Acidimicrobiia bacterium]|nr:EAL domain-containing protein [Acidimicrobiia bacterium]
MHHQSRWSRGRPFATVVIAAGAGALLALRPWGAIGAAAGGVLSGLAIMLAWWSWRSHRAAGRRLDDLEVIHRFAAVCEVADTTDELVVATIDTCLEVFGADLAEVVMARGVGSTVTSRRSSEASLTRRPATPILLAALAGAERVDMPILLVDAPVEVVAHYGERGVRDGMLATLRGGGGSDTTIVVGLPDGRTASSADLGQLGELAGRARIAFERVRLMERLQREISQKDYQVLHDGLTGIPNRLQFSIVTEDAIRTAMGNSETVAVLLIDLDLFKEINETLGHQRGDVVLREVASRLTEATRPGEHVARLGGDEFGVVIRGVDGVTGAAAEARRFADAVQRPLITEGLTLQVTASIGIALAPEHGTESSALLRHAEVAMYEAKRTVAAIEVYDTQHDRYSTRRLALAAELRAAIDSGGLGVHYQPKADLADGRVTGFEALARWTHARLGSIPPDEFIELAERTGLIRPLTELVLRTALADGVRLGADRDGLSIAVNIAPSSLNDPAFPGMLAEIIGESGIDPSAVILEVTESTMMADSAKARQVLEGLDELGVQLSIDDFGTGYSSLYYLSSLPVDEVKIDRSFVMRMSSDARSAAIVRSTIALVHALDMRVVAEGVEDRATWDQLRSAGCDLVQGYYLARPMPFTDLSAWLAQSRLSTEELDTAEDRDT